MRYTAQIALRHTSHKIVRKQNLKNSSTVPPNRILFHLNSNNILSFKAALQLQFRYSSHNLAHGSWNFWYVIEVQTILKKCVVFFFQNLICYCFFNIGLFPYFLYNNISVLLDKLLAYKR